MSWANKTEVFEEEHKGNVIKEEECVRKDALEETKKGTNRGVYYSSPPTARGG